MTEIPDHLLQRSRERRAAMGGGDGGDAGAGAGNDASSGSAAPAKAAATAPAAMPAHPAPVEDPPPPPPSPMVEAYERRKRIPYWAMPVLAILPVWAYVFVGTLDPPPEGETPASIGTAEYGTLGCAGCHGAGGGGGVGPGFSGGAVYETWPSFVDHFAWVRAGSAAWLRDVGPTYGANDTPVGGGMPGFGEDVISDAELIYVILHERADLGGTNPDPEDADLLERVAEYLFEHEDATLEEALAEVGAEPAAAES